MDHPSVHALWVLAIVALIRRWSGKRFVISITTSHITIDLEVDVNKRIYKFLMTPLHDASRSLGSTEPIPRRDNEEHGPS